jgi:hypothetical protein
LTDQEWNYLDRAKTYLRAMSEARSSQERMRYLDSYLFWRTAYESGKDEALRLYPTLA